MVLIEDIDDEPSPPQAKPPASEWRRIQVVEADSDDEAAEETKTPSPKPSGPPRRVWSDPCPDLEITCTVVGMDEAKSRGNRLYVDGKVADSERWFTKALWLYESGKVRDVPGDLRCALHTNRALARLKLQRFGDAEHDCSTVLEEKPDHGKARYRRACARFEQGKLVPALEDAKKALQHLPADAREEAQDMKAQIEEHLGSTAGAGRGENRQEKGKQVKENGGYHRIPIKEVDQAANHQPKEEPQVRPAVAQANGGGNGSAEPFPDLQVEPTLAGVEKAKQKANELFQKGELSESVRWFSKAIWLLESGKISGAGALRSILHSNRAFAQSKLQMWPEVEADCNEALTFNEKNAKALWRRAHARLELNKLDAALADVNLLLPQLAGPPSNREALDLKTRILEAIEARDKSSKKPEAAAKSAPEPSKVATKEASTKPPASQAPAGFRRMEIVEASDSEEETAPAPKPKEEAAPKPATPSPPPAGFKRMEIVEASDDSEEETAPAAKPRQEESRAAKPKEAPTEPFADIKLEYSVAGVEKAKDTGNKLFQEGKIEESDRWFSKALWLAEESGKVAASDVLKGILHSNRAFARLQLRQWSSAEMDCTEALKLNSENPKALYRRALARKELEKFEAALEDVNHLLPKLDSLTSNAAKKLKDELESKLRVAPSPGAAAPAPSLNGTAKESTAKPATPPPAGFKRMEIVEASDSEEESAPAKPKAAPAAPAPSSSPPAGFKRMEIVEASDDEDEESGANGETAAAPVSAPEKAPSAAPPSAPAEPFADIQIEHSVAGLEKAKDTGNKLFQDGKLTESERWFSKAIWLVEESGKVTAPESLRGILHSNRAFARLQLKHWSPAEADCNKALELNSKNAKALYRRALARKELKNFQSALDDVKQLLPMLDSAQLQNAQKLKEELESKLCPAAPAPAPVMNGKNHSEATKPLSPVQPPAGFKRMDIVEASDDESEEEEEAAPVAQSKEVPPAPAEPFADIQVEPSLASVEKAKETGSKLFQEEKFEESERWFSKALWMVESGKVTAPEMKGILHSNRAFARLQLKQWQPAEADCNEALKVNSKNAKALYRRALARKELQKFQGALDDVTQLLPFLDGQNNEMALKLKKELESKLDSHGPARMNGKNDGKASPGNSAPTASRAPPVVTEISEEPPPRVVEQPTSPSSSSFRPSSASARAIAAVPSIPSSSPKNSMEMLRQFKSLKKHPAVLTKYITQKVPPALLQSLFNRSPIEADDLALVLQSLRTAASDEAEPLTGDRVGEYLQQLLRTHTADTQFSMLSTSEKEMVRNLASLAPNGDDLKKTFAKVL